jgi:hypothetical protein
MKKHIQSIILASTGILSCLLVSCAGSMDTAALVPANVTASHHTGRSVNAVVSGGGARSKVLANISDEDFKQALESSLVKSGMFTSMGSGGYQIEAFITSVQQPLMGVSMRVNMEVSYAMRRNGAVIWRKSIKSTYSAPMGEAFVGAVRVRKATEGAARENIATLIHSLDEKQL